MWSVMWWEIRHHHDFHILCCSRWFAVHSNRNGSGEITIEGERGTKEKVILPLFFACWWSHRQVGSGYFCWWCRLHKSSERRILKLLERGWLDATADGKHIREMCKDIKKLITVLNGAPKTSSEGLEWNGKGSTSTDTTAKCSLKQRTLGNGKYILLGRKLKI